MPKLLISILVLGTALLTGGIFYVVKHGYKPESVKILDFSQFEQSKQIGAAIFKRFWSEIQTAKIVILGEDPRLKEGTLIWDGFIEEAARMGVTFDSVLVRPDLDPIPQFADHATRILVRLESSDAAIADLARRGWANALILHESEFVPQATDEIQKVHVCESDKDVKLECQIQKISKQYRRKKRYDPKRFIGVMEQTYPTQYVLFIYEPQVTP